MKFYKQSTTIICSMLFLGEYTISFITISTFHPDSCEIHLIKTALLFLWVQHHGFSGIPHQIIQLHVM